MIVAFYLFIHISNNDSISEIKTSPVATVVIGKLSPSKFKYETLQIIKDFIKLSEWKCGCILNVLICVSLLLIH